MLYQLSYFPNYQIRKEPRILPVLVFFKLPAMPSDSRLGVDAFITLRCAGDGGIEPPTFRLTAERSPSWAKHPDLK